jgi:hypothetical protein
MAAILTQIDKHDNFYAISIHCSLWRHRQLFGAWMCLMSISKVNNLSSTDHKPLKKMGHLHTKTMNRLQASLLEHNFILQYKKGANMPADYLSSLPSVDTINITSVTDELLPFILSRQICKTSNTRTNNSSFTTTWTKYLPKSEANYFQNLAPKLFQGHDKIIWIRILQISANNTFSY